MKREDLERANNIIEELNDIKCRLFNKRGDESVLLKRKAKLEKELEKI